MASPTQIEAGTTDADLQTAAQIVEMLLIRDHSRMKFEAVTPYDSTHAQQIRLLPVSHPSDWAATSEQFRSNEILPHQSPRLGAIKPSHPNACEAQSIDDHD
ncbi:hypothetical protein I1A62_07005 [Rhodococcus sp. USK10]|nr:hypothetical protein I1A62_07005 [Rhodococcus sp. USK10]